MAVIWHLAMPGMTEPSSHLLTIMDLSSSTSCSSSANSLKDSAVRKEEAGQWSWDVAPECGDTRQDTPVWLHPLHGCQRKQEELSFCGRTV